MFRRLASAIWLLSFSTCPSGVKVFALPQLLQGLRPALTVCDTQCLLQRLAPAIVAFLSSTSQSGVTVCANHYVLQRLGTALLDLMVSTCPHAVTVCAKQYLLPRLGPALLFFFVVDLPTWLYDLRSTTTVRRVSTIAFGFTVFDRTKWR